MHPIIFSAFQRIVGPLKLAGRVLEIGAVPDSGSLLSMPELAGCDRVGINMSSTSGFDGFDILQMNANGMRFPDAHFDAVLSNATLEHDGRFWLSLAEMRRVLKPGGVAIMGVPGFAPPADLAALGVSIGGGTAADDYHNATLTFRYHGAPDDYYRFSEHALRTIFFDGYRDIGVASVMTPPRLIGHGFKIGD